MCREEMTEEEEPPMCSNSKERPSKRLLFDRRYGLVLDEWRDPSEEALDGGRGMFCIIPLAKGLFKMASNLANNAASSTTKVIESPDLLSLPNLQATVNDHLHKFTSAVKNPQLDLLAKRSDLQ